MVVTWYCVVKVVLRPRPHISQLVKVRHWFDSLLHLIKVEIESILRVELGNIRIEIVLRYLYNAGKDLSDRGSRILKKKKEHSFSSPSIFGLG